MSRYIRLDDALKAYDEAMDELVKWQMNEWQLGDFSECEFNTTDCKHIARKITNAPSIDIVRCSECKHNVGLTNGFWEEDIVCDYWESDGLTTDDYCSYGERKTDE